MREGGGEGERREGEGERREGEGERREGEGERREGEGEGGGSRNSYDNGYSMCRTHQKGAWRSLEKPGHISTTHPASANH